MTTIRAGIGPAGNIDRTFAASAFGLASPEPPPRAVWRQRLSDELSLERPWRLALLTGGPATGKTVAAAQWLASLDDRVARVWITLSRSDQDPGQFWRAMAGALARALDVPGTTPREFAFGSSDHSAESLMRGMTELGDVDHDVAVVIDDAHVVRRPEVWADLRWMIEQLPKKFRLVLTSRVDPPLPLGLWTARRWLVQIRQSALSFTLPETFELLERMGQDDLDASATEELWRHTEGWIAALHLAVAHIRGHPDPRRAAMEFSGRHQMVADLLVSEVLDVQSDQVRDFMLRTSVLETLDPELCDAVAGRDDSALVLSMMETEIPFLVAQETTPRTYRYHPLFLETLRGQLATRYPGAKRQLELVAGRVCERRGDTRSAVRYWIAAGDHDRAARVAFRLVFDRADRNDLSLAEEWISLFGTDRSAESVATMLTYAASLGLVGRIDDASVWIGRAQIRLAEGLEASPDEAADADALQLLIFTLAGVAPSVTTGRGVIRSGGNGRAGGPLADRSGCQMARAHLIMDQPEAARQVLESGFEEDEIGRLLVRPAVASRIALAHGELTIAEELSFSALAASKALGLDGHVGVFDAGLARVGVLLERADLDQARASLADFMAIIGTRPRIPVYQLLGQLAEVRLTGRLAGPDEGIAALESLRGSTRGHRSPLGLLIDAAEARWRMEAGQLHHAEELVARLPEDCGERPLLAARLELSAGRSEDAAAHLERLGGGGSIRQRVTCALLWTRLAMVREDPSQLDEHLSRAVELAAREGLALPVIEEGEPLVRLARTKAERMLTARGDQFAAALGAPSRRRTMTELSLLSDRESAVLRYLPTRLTNREIAGECFMSVNTVKTHIKSIYAKLGVSSRSDAVERARLHGLL